MSTWIPPAVRWTGYIQARETYRDGVGLTGSINRARLTAYGAVKDLTWRVQGEFRTGSVGTGKARVSLQDAYVRYKTGNFGIQAGQYKTPFTMEFIRSLADVETADRATVVDSLAPKRDIGLMADYAIGAVGTLTLGVFNGEGQNITTNADSSLLWVGRATVRPVAYLTLGANVAAYQSDSTRYGIDATLEYMGAAFRGGIHRTAPGRRSARRQGLVRPGDLPGPSLSAARAQAGGLPPLGEQRRAPQQGHEWSSSSPDVFDPRGL